MRFGFCTGFATHPRFTLDVSLLRRIRLAGFDFPDLPVMAFEAVPHALLTQVHDAWPSMACPAACNLFPAHLKLVGPDVRQGALEAYLAKVLPLMRSFGITHLVLGSAQSRMLPPGMEVQAGKEQLGHVLESCVLPVVRAFSMDILMEPLNRGECNLLNTVQECAGFVRALHLPGFALMADLYHMEANGEDPETLRDAMPLIHHLHVAGPGRTFLLDPYLCSAIRIVKECGYDETISYETEDGDLKKAAMQLRSAFS